jgi:hypothetical protein
MIGVLGFDFRQVLGIFLCSTASRTAPGPTQPPIQWVPAALSLGVKRSGREADHSPPYSSKVKTEWSYTSTTQYAFMAWCSVKKKHRDNFTLPLEVLFHLISHKVPRYALFRILSYLLLRSQNIFLSTSSSNTICVFPTNLQTTWRTCCFGYLLLSSAFWKADGVIKVFELNNSNTKLS